MKKDSYLFEAVLPHGTGDIAFRRLNQHVIMVGHQAVGGNPDIPGLASLLEQIDKGTVVMFVQKNILRSAAAVHDMVPSTGIGYSDRA